MLGSSCRRWWGESRFGVDFNSVRDYEGLWLPRSILGYYENGGNSRPLQKQVGMWKKMMEAILVIALPLLSLWKKAFSAYCGKRYCRRGRTSFRNSVSHPLTSDLCSHYLLYSISCIFVQVASFLGNLNCIHQSALCTQLDNDRSQRTIYPPAAEGTKDERLKNVARVWIPLCLERFRTHLQRLWAWICRLFLCSSRDADDRSGSFAACWIRDEESGK